MPVYIVTLIAPNGNRVTRPILAADEDQAVGIMESAHHIHNAYEEGFEVEAAQMADPDREVEASLLRMEARTR